MGCDPIEQKLLGPGSHLGPGPTWARGPLGPGPTWALGPLRISRYFQGNPGKSREFPGIRACWLWPIRACWLWPIRAGQSEHAGYGQSEHAGYGQSEHAGYGQSEHAGYDPGEMTPRDPKISIFQKVWEWLGLVWKMSGDLGGVFLSYLEPPNSHIIKI